MFRVFILSVNKSGFSNVLEEINLNYILGIKRLGHINTSQLASRDFSNLKYVMKLSASSPLILQM